MRIPTAAARQRGPAWLALAAGVATVIPSGVDAQQRRIKVGEGVVAGKPLDHGGTLFAGIPYAAPPVAELRWRPPAPARAWAGVRDATKFGATCVQPAMGWNAGDAARGAEDCLTLNIWTPPGRTGRLPVMLWIHGGAFLGGSGSNPIFDASTLSRKGVIVVTINYRLGVLGFLAHPELSASTRDRTSGNYGLQDQIAALGWVARNIASFGGDPSNVTIFGQSAGSISVASLLTIPEARHHFRRAILESGTPFGIGELPLLGEAEAAAAGLGRLADLRAMSAPDLVALWSRFSAGSPGTRRAIPAVDGRVLTRQPADAYLAGAIRDVPILVGSNVREIPPAGREALLQAAAPLFGADAASELTDYEKRGGDPLAGNAPTQMLTDLLFRCGTLATAASSHRAWLYHFLDNFPGRPEPSHSAEVFYVFGNPPKGAPVFDPAQTRLSDTMMDYWTNFAKRGDPNGEGAPAWPRYAQSTGAYLDLTASGVRPQTNLRAEACRPYLDRWLARAGNPRSRP